jgi:tetratricopeptide (TPR) repeat protein
LAAVGARTPVAVPPESVSKRDPAPVQHKPGLPGKEAVPARARLEAPLAASDSASLGAAKSELARGNIAAALEMYGRLIRKGKSLTDIIRELREALYRYPVEVPIWQSLGDAYMRANRLQEALDAYTKAEELLR